MINNGIIVNTDTESIENKVLLKTEESNTAGGYFSSLVNFAKSSVSAAMRK